MLTEAVLVPVAVGVKVTLIVQVPDAATLLPQLLVCAKSLESVPAIPILVTLSAVVVLVFVSVTGSAALVTPGVWAANDSTVGEKDTAAPVAATPEAVREMF